MALGLELPEDTLVNLHKWGDSDSHSKLHQLFVLNFVPNALGPSASSVHEILPAKRRGRGEIQKCYAEGPYW